MTTRKQLLDMLDDIEERQEHLRGDWEEKFIDDLMRYMRERGGFPSSKQEEKLEEIWTRVTTAQPGVHK